LNFLVDKNSPPIDNIRGKFNGIIFAACLKKIDSLKFNHSPYIRKTKLVPKCKKQKTQVACLEMLTNIDFQVGLKPLEF